MYTNPYEFFKRKANEQIDSFREVARGEDSRVDGTIVLTDAYDEITIPEIGLFSLQNVRYVDVLSRVNNADPVDCFSEATMRRLWQGIVINVFDFEPEWAKKAKLEEVESEEARRYWTWVGGYRVASEARQIPPTPRDFLSSGPRDNRAGIGNEKDIKQHKQHTSAEQIIPRPKAQDKQHRQHAPTGKVSSWLKTQGNQHKQQTSAKRVFPQPKAHVPAMNNALGSGSGEINAGIGNQKDDKQNKQHPSAERIYPRPKAHGPSIRYPPVTPDLGRLREHVLRKRTGVQCEVLTRPPFIGPLTTMLTNDQVLNLSPPRTGSIKTRVQRMNAIGNQGSDSGGGNWLVLIHCLMSHTL